MINAYWNARSMAVVFGIALIAAGLIGFVPNGFAGPGALFEANIPHNLVHIVTGSLAIAIALQGFGMAVLWALSVFYVAFCISGFWVGGGPYICGVVKINPADNYLHMALTAVFVGTAILLALGRGPLGRRLGLDPALSH